MAKKNKDIAGHVPRGNQTRFGPKKALQKDAPKRPHGGPASEQDPKRRLGNFTTAGEHAIEQPVGKQGADH